MIVLLVMITMVMVMQMAILILSMTKKKMVTMVLTSAHFCSLAFDHSYKEQRRAPCQIPSQNPS